MSDVKRVEKSAEEVAAQREVKKSEDAIRKQESKLGKLVAGTPEHAETQGEIDRLRARIAELCAQFGIESKADKKAAHKAAATGPTAAPTPVSPPAPVIATPPPAPEPAAPAVDTKRVEKSAEEVAAQREVKKSEDAIRKQESKLGKLVAGTPEHAETQGEIDRLRARIAELCAQFGIESKADKKAAHKAGPAAPAAAAPLPSLSIGVVTSSAARVDPARLREELEQVKGMLMASTNPKEVAELKARLSTLLDLCITMASEQVSLATARASPAVVPRTHTAPMPAIELGTAAVNAASGSAAPATGGAAPTAAAAPAAAASHSVAAAAANATNASNTAANNATTTSGAINANGSSALSPMEHMMGSERTESDSVAEGVHPRFLDLAIHTKLLQVVGGNARMLAFVDATLAFVRSTRTLAEDMKLFGTREKGRFFAEFTRNVDALNAARPLCRSIHHIIEQINSRIANGEFVLQENNFIRDQVAAVVADVADVAVQSIRKLSERTQEVADDDVILVYGRSSSIEALLMNVAANRRRQESERAGAGGGNVAGFGFGGGPLASSSSSVSPAANDFAAPSRLRVIVLDSAPLFEGRGLARRLQANGVAVRYALASAMCQLMPHCTKVFLGASAVMQSGDVVNRCGSAMVAAAAKAAQRPVFVFAEDHKMTREVWIGSLTQNQLVDSAFPALAGETAFQQRLFGHGVKPNGYLYDVTPSSLIDVIVTRMGRIHPTAACSLIMPEGDDNNKDGTTIREDAATTASFSDEEGEEEVDTDREATSSIGFKSPAFMH